MPLAARCRTGCARNAATTAAGRSSPNAPPPRRGRRNRRGRRPRRRPGSARGRSRRADGGVRRHALHRVRPGGRAGAPALGDAGARSSTRPVAISNSEDPARAVRAKPDASIVQAAQAVAEGRADALVSAGSTGATLAAGPAPDQAHARRLPPGAGGAAAGAGPPDAAARRGRHRRGPSRAARAVRVHGRRVHGGGDGRRRARASDC